MPVETTTPAFSALRMLRRHSWFMPASTSSSVRRVPSSARPAGSRRCTAAGRRRSRPRRPGAASRAPRAAGRRGRRSARRARTAPARSRLCTPGSAMPALTCSAVQRRVTTGGPIRTPNAPWPRRCSVIGASQSREVVASLRLPVEHRPLGQVGEVARQPRQLAVEHEPDADQAVRRRTSPATRRATPTSPSPRPGVCRKLAHGCSRMNARCSSAEIVRTVGTTATRLPGCIRAAGTALLRVVRPHDRSAKPAIASGTPAHSKDSSAVDLAPNPAARGTPLRALSSTDHSGMLREATRAATSEEASDERPAPRRRAPSRRRTPGHARPTTPCPPGMVDRMVAVTRDVADHDPDLELQLMLVVERFAELVGTRGGARSYTLRFGGEGVDLLVRVGVSEEEGRARLDGWIVPAASGPVAIHEVGGEGRTFEGDGGRHREVRVPGPAHGLLPGVAQARRRADVRHPRLRDLTPTRTRGAPMPDPRNVPLAREPRLRQHPQSRRGWTPAILDPNSRARRSTASAGGRRRTSATRLMSPRVTAARRQVELWNGGRDVGWAGDAEARAGEGARSDLKARRAHGHDHGRRRPRSTELPDAWDLLQTARACTATPTSCRESSSTTWSPPARCCRTPSTSRTPRPAVRGSSPTPSTCRTRSTSRTPTCASRRRSRPGWPATGPRARGGRQPIAYVGPQPTRRSDEEIAGTPSRGRGARHRLLPALLVRRRGRSRERAARPPRHRLTPTRSRPRAPRRPDRAVRRLDRPDRRSRHLHRRPGPPGLPRRRRSCRGGAIPADEPMIESEWLNTLAQIAELARRHRNGEDGGSPDRRPEPVDGLLPRERGRRAGRPDPAGRSSTSSSRNGVVVVASAGNDATDRPSLPGGVRAVDRRRGPVKPRRGVRARGVGRRPEPEPHRRPVHQRRAAGCGATRPVRSVMSTMPPFAGWAPADRARLSSTDGLRESIDPDDYRAARRPATPRVASGCGAVRRSPHRPWPGRIAAADVARADDRWPNAADSARAATTRGWNAVEAVTTMKRPRH